MSVAAMTMDDQRPLMSNYDKMPKQYEQNLHAAAGSGGGGGAPSGPASPTPSEEHHQYHQHQHHHHHHSHHQQQFHHRHQHAPPPLMSEQQPQLPASSQELLPPTIAEAVAAAAQRQRQLEDEIESLKLEQTRLAQQSADAQRREKILMRRLANKEQEFQDYVSQIAEYKAAQAPSALALRSALLDPAVNLLFEKLKKELKATKAKLEETQNELSAWKFTPDSNTGKCLMAKCRLLYQENEELGKMTSNGRLAKLETELAMQKSFSEEVKKSQSELDDFLQELDEDVEGMQSTILFLQQELKTTRDRIHLLEKENYQLKNDPTNDLVKEAELATNNSSTSPPLQAQAQLNGQVPVDSALSSTTAINNTLTTSYAQNNQQAQPIQLIVPPTTNNEIKLETPSTTTTPLATIDENSCLKAATTATTTTAAATVAVNEFYNGNDEAQAAALPLVDDGSNGSNSNNSAGKLRTPASRKRNYDSIDSNEIITSAVTPVVALPLPVVAPPTHVVVSAPRTLPPKKSKLRVSARSVELNETPDFVPVVGGTGILAAVDPLAFVDNAVAGMANEEVASSVVSADETAAVDVSVTAGGNAVAQRIMTRRRSVRPQQNGSGDSNH